MKISGVYRIVNMITGYYYIGSTIDLERRKYQHFHENYWRQQSNNLLYKDMKQYGKDNFLFEPIWLCNPEELKKYEQIAIEKYNPRYNIRVAYTGLTGLTKEQYHKQYYEKNIDSIKQYHKQWCKENSDSIKQYNKQYNNQQCLYEGELLSLNTLTQRFFRRGIQHPTAEAKKYLV